MRKRLAIYSIIAAVVSGLLWFSEIPQGIWLARTVYHSQTINGQIAAVKAENERLQKLVKEKETPTPTPEPPK